MQLEVVARQPAGAASESADRSRLRVPHPVGVDDGPLAPPGRPYSFLAECECPDDCLRDHENE